MTVSKVKDNVSQTGHITTSVKQPLYLYGIREGNGNEGREGKGDGRKRKGKRGNGGKVEREWDGMEWRESVPILVLPAGLQPCRCCVHSVVQKCFFFALAAKLLIGSKKLRGCKNDTDLLHHHVKYGWDRGSRAGYRRKSVIFCFFLFVTRLEVRSLRTRKRY